MATSTIKQSTAWVYLGEFNVSASYNLPSNYSEVMIIGSIGGFEWETVQAIFPKGYVGNISAIGKNNTTMVAHINASGTASVTTASSASNVTKYRLYYR